jgi:hypothetical protein
LDNFIKTTFDDTLKRTEDIVKLKQSLNLIKNEFKNPEEISFEDEEDHKEDNNIENFPSFIDFYGQNKIEDLQSKFFEKMNMKIN